MAYEDLEKFEQLPSLDIARSIARLYIIQCAFREAPGIYYKGWGDDGQSAWTIADRSLSTDEVMNDELFGEEVLKGLNENLPQPHQHNAIPFIQDKLTVSDEMPISHGERAEWVTRKAAQVGLRCVGIIEGNGSFEINPAAYAALAYERADIRNPYDRKLYEREPEINKQLEPLLMQPRTIDATYGRTDEAGEKVKRMSMYSFVSFATQATLQATGYSSHQDAWWAELKKDFKRVDSVITGSW